MTASTTSATPLRGGEFLLRGPDRPILTPERLTEEHRLIARTVNDFVDGEVLPVLDRLEQKDWKLSRELVQRAGALGLLGADVAEIYGGDALDKTTSLVISDWMGHSASFAVTFGAQANLTILPLSLFGTDAQKRQYLPGLMSGAAIGAYCLSEAGAGSDALGARTRATRLADGAFLLNGEKMWTSNGGFADVFIVFAKVDGEHFTAFIVERAFPGVTSGKEEHKMGLHGSSTTPIVLQDVRVPAANVLGEVGKAHKIAFNVLNFARLKLGAACGGTARHAIGVATRYAAERRQFGRPISSFGAIQHKLGEMVTRMYAVESLLYRTAGMIDTRIDLANGAADPASALPAFEEYAIEASMAKVAGSEMLDFVLDENIQIHGGNGYVHDYTPERLYRDARVNRIFEGTNEINRLLIPGLIARRAAKGDLPIAAAALAVQEALSAPGSAGTAGSGTPLAREIALVDRFKNAALMIFAAAWQRYGQTLQDEQEVLLCLADMLIDVYASESAALRAAAAADAAAATAPLHAAAARVFISDATARIEASGRRALAAMLDGEGLARGATMLHRLLESTPINTVELRRQLAGASLARTGYPF